MASAYTQLDEPTSLQTQVFEDKENINLDEITDYKNDKITSPLIRAKYSIRSYANHYPTIESFLKQLNKSDSKNWFLGGLATSTMNDTTGVAIFPPLLFVKSMFKKSDKVTKQLICKNVVNNGGNKGVAQLIEIAGSDKTDLNSMFKNKVLFTIFPNTVDTTISQTFPPPIEYPSVKLIDYYGDITIVYDTKDGSIYITTMYALSHQIAKSGVLFYVDPNLLRNTDTVVSWIDERKNISLIDTMVSELFTLPTITAITNSVMNAATYVLGIQQQTTTKINDSLKLTSSGTNLGRERLLNNVVWFATVHGVANGVAYIIHSKNFVADTVVTFFSDNIEDIIDAALKYALDNIGIDWGRYAIYNVSSVFMNQVMDHTTKIITGMINMDMDMKFNNPILIPLGASGGNRIKRKNKITFKTRRRLYKKTKKIRFNKHSNHKKYSKNKKSKHKKSKKSVRT